MPPILFAANWKMHHGPVQAEAFAREFRELTFPSPDRELWFFPPAVSIGVLADAFRSRPDIRIGCQDVHWEAAGAFTGALSIPMVEEAGASAALVGHSERRHVFGETDADTGKKVTSLLKAGFRAMLCVGETLVEREAGKTEAVVLRQLNAGLGAVAPGDWPYVLVAYEPVWAIGTGRNATPDDAAAVHGVIREWIIAHGGPADVRILYGGSVKAGNVLALVSREGIDGVLVGGASLTPDGWAEIVGIGETTGLS